MTTSLHDILSNADPYARTAQVFPMLEPGMVERIGHYGNIEDIDAGAALFVKGGRSADFFVVLDGEIGIYKIEHNHTNSEQLVTVHRSGQFTGELNHLSERALLVD